MGLLAVVERCFFQPQHLLGDIDASAVPVAYFSANQGFRSARTIELPVPHVIVQVHHLPYRQASPCGWAPDGMRHSFPALRMPQPRQLLPWLRCSWRVPVQHREQGSDLLPYQRHIRLVLRRCVTHREMCDHHRLSSGNNQKVFVRRPPPQQHNEIQVRCKYVTDMFEGNWQN
jgi:hypothetical protein